MEDIKVGEYFRSKNIGIMKFVYGTSYITKNGKEDYIYYLEYEDKKIMPLSLEELKDMKHSPNIIDLIEVGDYVNGFYVINKPFNRRIHTEFDDFFEKDIKSIVTKEIFSNVEYRVENN